MNIVRNRLYMIISCSTEGYYFDLKNPLGIRTIHSKRNHNKHVYRHPRLTDHSTDGSN